MRLNAAGTAEYGTSFLKQKKGECFYLLGYMAFIGASFLFDGILNKPRVLFLACALITAWTLAVTALHSDFWRRKWPVRAAVLALFGIAAVVSRKGALLACGALLVCAEMTTFERIVKTSFFTCLAAVLGTVLLDLIGLAPVRYVTPHFGLQAYTFGFGWYHMVPYTFLYLVLEYLYLKHLRRQKASWIELAIILGFNYGIYRLSTLRLTYYLNYATVFLYIVLVKFGWIDLSKKWLTGLTALIFPAAFAFTVCISVFYSDSNALLAAANKKLSWRLFLGHQGLERYPVNLFGHYVQTDNWFYIDSGFLYALLGYGALLTAAVLLMYAVIHRSAARNNEKELFIWLVIIAGFSLVNNTWLALFENPALLLLPFLLAEKGKRPLPAQAEAETGCPGENRRILEIMGEGISHGGEEAFIANLLDSMDPDGLTVDWLTPYRCNNRQYAQILEEKGGKVYELGLSYTPGKSRWHVIAPLDRFFREHAYDAVHIHSGSTSILAIVSWLAHGYGIKRIIVHSHTAGNHGFKSKLIKIAFSPVLKSCPTDYLACSMDAAVTKYPAAAVKNHLTVINNGINLDKYRADTETRQRIRQEMNIPSDARVIGHVGRFSREKNHAFLLDVFARLLKKRGDCFLLLVGDGELMQAVREKAESLGIAERVRFAGFVNNVADYYQAMDLFALSSLYEGFPIALVEAQAAGLPCVYADQVTADASIGQNVCRLPLNDTDAWVSAIEDHLADGRSDNRQKLLEKGFDIRDTARRLKALYLKD